METSTWHWGTACVEPSLPGKALPPDCLVFECLLNGNNYWAAYKRGRQVDGATYPRHYLLDRDEGLHLVHTLQWVKGYGPVYWCNGPDEYYRVNLFLIESNEEKLSQRIGMEVFQFDPHDL